MNRDIAEVLGWAVEAAYGRYDDVSVGIFLTRLTKEGIEGYGVEVSNGDTVDYLLDVEDCIDHIKEWVD